MTKRQKEINKNNNSRWTVIETKPIPPFFQLERGSKQINKSASFISQSIDTYLRLKSIDAIFDSENAEANCKTSDNMRFKIFLYAGSSPNSTFVEMMKLKGGCGFSFTKERDNIMNVAATGIGEGDGETIVAGETTNQQSTMFGDKTVTFRMPPSFI